MGRTKARIICSSLNFSLPKYHV
uniref:Uncharacterized protein n=1 Tax=Arundo donax TaxID=35708 RepID=A0A0A9AZU8_ARUDO